MAKLEEEDPESSSSSPQRERERKEQKLMRIPEKSSSIGQKSHFPGNGVPTMRFPRSRRRRRRVRRLSCPVYIRTIASPSPISVLEVNEYGESRGRVRRSGTEKKVL